MLQVRYVALGILYLYFYVLVLQKFHYQNVDLRLGRLMTQLFLQIMQFRQNDDDWSSDKSCVVKIRVCHFERGVAIPS